MHESSEETTTWNIPGPSYPSLTASNSTDVVIIGGGLTGLLSAYLLTQQGKKVILIEKNTLGSGATGATTAWITESLDTDFTEIISSFPLEQGKEIIASHEDAIELITDIVKEHHIDCDFKRCSAYIYINKEDELPSLKEECEAAVKLGVPASMHTDGSALGFPNHGYIEIQNQAMFHPMKFLYALAKIVSDQGAQIFEHSEVDRLTTSKPGIQLQVGKFTIDAAWAISATYEPFHEPLKLFFKKGMYTSYVFELSVTGMQLVEGLFEDTENPYNYMRVEKEGEGYRVIAGGQDHRADLPVSETKSFNALKEYIDSIIPEKNYTVVRHWKGPILEPIDGFPLIGAMNNDPVLYALGFSGTGMTYGAIAAQLFSEEIAGTHTMRHDIYSPKRPAHIQALLHKGTDYVQEFFHAALKNTFTESSKLDEKITEEEA